MLVGFGPCVVAEKLLQISDVGEVLGRSLGMLSLLHRQCEYWSSGLGMLHKQALHNIHLHHHTHTLPLGKLPFLYLSAELHASKVHHPSQIHSHHFPLSLGSADNNSVLQFLELQSGLFLC